MKEGDKIKRRDFDDGIERTVVEIRDGFVRTKTGSNRIEVFSSAGVYLG